MRSFRAENVSLLVKQLLDLEMDEARKTLANVSEKYPIVLTRDLANAKFPDWHIYISSRLTDSEYASGHVLEQLQSRRHVDTKDMEGRS